MEKLTAYTDIFQAYEYVMNRVEGRFMPQLVGKQPEDTDALLDEIISYLTQSDDPADFMNVFSRSSASCQCVLLKTNSLLLLRKE